MLLKYELFGTGYYEEITVTLDEERVIYSGDSFRLTSMIDGVLHLDLNFGTSRAMPYRVTRIGKKILLAPHFAIVEKYLPSGMLLDVRRFLALPGPKVFIFPEEQLAALCSALGSYMDGKLERVPPPSNDDLFIMWLLGSNFTAADYAVFSIPEYASALAKEILAEYPDRSPAVTQVIQMLLDGRLAFETSELCEVRDEPAVDVFIAASQERYIEWRAMLAADPVCILLDGMGVRLRAIDPDERASEGAVGQPAPGGRRGMADTILDGKRLSAGADPARGIVPGMKKLWRAIAGRLAKTPMEYIGVPVGVGVVPMARDAHGSTTLVVLWLATVTLFLIKVAKQELRAVPALRFSSAKLALLMVMISTVSVLGALAANAAAFSQLPIWIQLGGGGALLGAFFLAVLEAMQD